MKHILYTITLCLFCLSIGQSQNYVVPNAGETETFTVSQGDIFTDPGGPGGNCSSGGASPPNYPNCGCATVTTLTGVSAIEFLEFSVFGNFDYLEIYDGPDVNSPKIFDNRDFGPGWVQFFHVVAELGDPPVLNSSSGSLTFYFWATSVVNRCGYEILILEGSSDCEIQCPEDISVSNDPGECGAFVNVPEPEFVGPECGGTSSVIVVLDENFNDCVQPTGWINTTTTTGSTTPGGCMDALFSYECNSNNAAPFWMSNPGYPSGFEGCIAVIDDDALGGGGGTVGVHCIETPVMDLSGGGIELTFDFLTRDFFSDGIFLVEAWNGSTWELIFSQEGVVNGAGQTVSLSGFDNSDFQIRFCYDDEGNWSYGAAIDNVVVTANDPNADPEPPMYTNDYNNSENASDFYPVGTTTVIFSSPGVGSCEVNITVEDTEAPSFPNCNDIEITLGGGECGQFVNFDLDVTDNCPPVSASIAGPFCDPCLNPVAGGALACGGPPNVENSIIQFIETPGGGFLDGFCFEQNTGGFPLSPEIFVHIYEQQAPGVVPYINGGFTPIGTFNYPLSVADNGSCVCLDFPDPLAFSGGGIWIEIQTLDARAVGTPASCNGTPATGNDTYIASAACGFAAPITLASIGFNLDAPFSVFYNSGDLEAIPNPNASADCNLFESGEFLPIGEHCFQYIAEDGSGNVGTCDFTITVNEVPNPTSTLVCNDLVNVSLDQNCEALVNADMVLEGGPYKCYDDYNISIETLGGISVGNPISGQYIGQNLIVSVEDPDNGNSCWGYLFIEDKLKPTIECFDLILSCNDELPTEPAPGFSSLESIIYNPDDVLTNTLSYDFDFSYLPADAEVENVGVPIVLVSSNIAWLADISATITSPSGTSVTLINSTCTAPTVWTLDVEFDDAGDPFVPCVIPDDGRLLQPIGGGSLSDFNGESPSGTWTISFNNAFTFWTTNLETIGVNLFSSLQQIDPADNCGLESVDFIEVIEPGECDDEYSSVITRTWTATDFSGNQSSCDQVISIERGDINEYEAPPTWIASCGDNFDLDLNGHPHPSESGSPIIESCEEIVGNYTDAVIYDDCGGYKVIRTWTLVDWCTLENVELTQILKVGNDEEPEFLDCPDPGTIVNVSTRYNDCVGDYIAQQLTAINNCTGEEITDIVVTASAGTVVWNQQIQRYQVLNLPVGQHTITYSANDGCDNIAECTYILNVVDNVPPIALCDERTRVSLGSDGEALVHVSAWDDGSYDNCGIASILAYRKGIRHLFPAATTPCHEGNQNPDRNFPRPQIKFCCADIGEVEIVMEVTDVSGNMNICWV
nr:HYR domain-containing protein [Saprospiraceae bacterium]